ncbi:hypothetical protein ES703_78573 [subsurface metagenome]
MSTPYQTIIYHKPTGAILKVAPNQYISSKRHLANLVHRPHWKDVSFIYFPFPLEIDLGKHRVSQPSFPGPPYLTDASGSNLLVLALYASSKKLLIESKTILYSFEGGLGDYINEANVISYILSQHPDKAIYVSGTSDRFKLISCFPGFERVTFSTRAKCIAARMPSVDFTRISSFNYNYPPFGKRGVYASLAGMDPAFPQAKLSLPKESLEWAEQQWLKLPGKKTQLRISLHTRSGEPNAKTWPWKYTRELVDLLRAKYSGCFALFGGHGQESVEAKDTINGVGTYDWVQVASLLKTSHLVICIDSAIMHIGHHLDIPTLSLWGPTAASYILAKNHGTPVIESKVECHPCGNYGCRKGDCMQSITPAQVLKKAATIIKLLPGS